MKTIEKGIGVCILLIIAILSEFLKAYIIFDAGKLFNINFITQFSLIQIFIICLIISIFTFGFDSIKEYKDESDLYIKCVVKIIEQSLSYLEYWGILYLAYLIFL